MLMHTIRSAFIASAATLGLIATLANPVQAKVTPDDTITLFVGRSHQFTAPWDVAGASLTDPGVADVQVLTTRLVVISGRAAGTTDVILWNDEGATHSVRVEVEFDTARLELELNNLFPSAGGLKVRVVQGVTVVEGTLENPDDATQLVTFLEERNVPAVNRTRIPGVQQVQAKIRFAEVSRSGLRQMGVNLFKSGDTFFGGSLIGGSTNSALIGAPSGAGLGNTPFEFLSDIAVGDGVTLFAGFPKADFQVFINALAENNYVRVMAEPTLVAMSGEEANFLAGGEFPIPVVQGGGGGSGSSISVEFKEFGIALSFKPVVMGDGKIRLRIRSEVSDRNDLEGVVIPGTDAVVPAITRRTAETTLELASGQSFSMAGLLNESTTARRSQIPGLGDIPILGTLFRSVSYQSGQTELLVLVTVDLVEPMDDQALLPLPGELHKAPGDWELYGKGELEHDFSGVRVRNSEAPYVRALGLDDLKGPGAWAYHGQPPARPRPSAPAKTAAGGETETPPVDGNATSSM